MHDTAVNIDCVYPANNFLGESPVWCPASEKLYWINCEKEPTLFRFHPQSGDIEQWPMPQRIGAVALKNDGAIVVALAEGIHDFDPKTGQLQLIAKNPRPDTTVLHEGKCDRQGRFWIGSLSKRMQSHGELGGACFYRLDGDMLIPLIDDLSVSNGLAWSPDGRVMYHTDTPANTVWAYDYDVATGNPSGQRVLFTIDPAEGGLDGAAIDADGGYWIALFQGSCLRRYLADGSLDREITLPISQPTMPAFGGPLLQDIYVTTTRFGKLDIPGLGHLYRINNIAQGLKEVSFDPEQ